MKIDYFEVKSMSLTEFTESNDLTLSIIKKDDNYYVRFKPSTIIEEVDEKVSILCEGKTLDLAVLKFKDLISNRTIVVGLESFIVPNLIGTETFNIE